MIRIYTEDANGSIADLIDIVTQHTGIRLSSATAQPPSAIQTSRPGPPPGLTREPPADINDLQVIYLAEWVAGNVTKIRAAAIAEDRLKNLNWPFAFELTGHAYELIEVFQIGNSPTDTQRTWKVEQVLHRRIKETLSDANMSFGEFYRTNALKKTLGNAQIVRIKKLRKLIRSCIIEVMENCESRNKAT